MRGNLRTGQLKSGFDEQKINIPVQRKRPPVGNELIVAGMELVQHVVIRSATLTVWLAIR